MCDTNHPLYNLLHPDPFNKDIDHLWWKDCQKERSINDIVSIPEICKRVQEKAEKNKIPLSKAREVTSCPLDRESFFYRYSGWLLGFFFFLILMALTIYLFIAIRRYKKV